MDRQARVLLTGATGFLGRYVVGELVRRGFINLSCFVRQTSRLRPLSEYELDYRYGDLDDAESVADALEGIDVLVSLASLGTGHGPGTVKACEAANIQRGVFVSTTSVFTTLNAKSKVIRIAAEDAIAGSNLRYTILRPTMIYGSAADRNIWRLVRFIERYPVIPVFGSGRHLQQPVYVGDVANAVVDVLEHPVTERKSYNIPGASPISYNEIIDALGEALGKPVRKWHLPLGVSMFALGVYKALVRRPRVTPEQARRLNEPKAFDFRAAEEDFQYAPLSFREGLTIMLRFSHGADGERRRVANG